MPRKKREAIPESEPISVLHGPVEPEVETELINPPITEPPDELAIDPEYCARDFLTATLQSAQASISQLFEKQAELTGTQAADAVFDAFESAFISRLEARLQPFVDVLVPEIRDSHAQLQERTTARVERRLSAFDRLKQIAAIVTDECRLLPPVTAVGEFVTWEPIEAKEND
ncbi:hypothetical protein [Scytonema sp. PCC 10023]|uniref:hypothetical protein n=1 Tax=Scytonema sp. PCC 10023 TaxID=1680591 RepID=UPI0039C60AF6